MPCASGDAVARNANTGFRARVDDKTIVDNGKGPILLEPVAAQVAFPGRHIDSVRILDDDGRDTHAPRPSTAMGLLSMGCGIGRCIMKW